MLDLLQPADGSAAGWVSVGQEAPASCQSLRVLRVATEHANVQFATLGVVADVLRGTDVLTRRRRQVAHLDSERGHRLAHLFGRRHAGSRAEQESHDRAGAKPERQRTEGRGRKRGAEHDRTDRRERDEPGGEHTGTVDELRADDDERPRSPL